jgi:type I restriction enzyme R subunit
MAFNENSRVKLPAILHLCKLGYQYISLKGANIQSESNIFIDVFLESIIRINDGLTIDDARKKLAEITLVLDNEDLGKSFYEKLIDQSGIRLIDFENIQNNTLSVVTELNYKKDDEEFRPDITLLINGMPLVFIEVKKPNNRDGVLAERNRIDSRFSNRNFKKIINTKKCLIISAYKAKKTYLFLL